MNLTPTWNKPALLKMLAFAPLHRVILSLKEGGFPTLQDLNELLVNLQPTILVHSRMPLHFVHHKYGNLPFEDQYEPRCFLRGEVLTRSNNWHDLLNAFVWLTYPKSKSAINARHYHELNEMNKSASRSQRGSVRDTSTLLDESGVIVACADDELAELLRNFQWNELFWLRRSQLLTSMGFYLFGHGLYEKAMQPYIGLTGQGLIIPVDRVFFTWSRKRQLRQLDQLLANYLDSPANCRSTRELTPVPLLGIPGWSTENENAAYYDNTDYFRLNRRGN